jgi:hypothetical protein
VHSGCGLVSQDQPVSTLPADRFPFAVGPADTECSEEVALGVSFNTQSQAPDIPGASSRAAFLRDTASLQAQSKAPDSYALRAYTEELLGSLNAQAQAPDDPSSPKFYWTFICCRCARIWRCSWLLLTPRSMLLMIVTPRIASGLHVFSSKIHAIAVQ